MKVNIEICMGSSCFARGNSKILSSIEKYISEKKLSENIVIIGHLCMNNCSSGPVIRINGDDHLNLSESEILEILNSFSGG